MLGGLSKSHLRQIIRQIILLFPLLFLPHCINLPRSFHAASYRNQTIHLDRNHFYKVGPLSNDWRLAADKNPGIGFKNRVNKASIIAEAVCGRAFEDLSLELLTSNLLAGLENIKKVKTERWQLSGREGLYTSSLAFLDGVAVWLGTVVIKKDNCEFDFWAISKPELDRQVSSDFAVFVKGFDY